MTELEIPREVAVEYVKMGARCSNLIEAGLKKPCFDCPWRKDSPPGWLGQNDPEHLVRLVMAGLPHVCHTSVKWDGEGDEGFSGKGKTCVGALAAMANAKYDYKLTNVLKMAIGWVGPRDDVFANFKEFLDHHNSAQVKSWKL